MQITVIGLGKMGLSLAKQLTRKGHVIQGYDVNPKISDDYVHENMTYISDLSTLNEASEKNVVFLLLPAGDPTNESVDRLSRLLHSEDIVVDFSNSYYQDSIKNYDRLETMNIHYYDCGLSGGVSGALNGACMMLGGDDNLDPQIISILQSLCVEGGFNYYGQPGSGHYLKMVHNGIEYGMMQAIAEGLELLHAQKRYMFNLEKVTSNWSNGSIISSALMDNIYEELHADNQLSQFQQKVHASGEARWMVSEALKEEVPVPTVALSLMKRNASLIEQQFSNQVLSAMRYNFGGHKEY